MTTRYLIAYGMIAAIMIGGLVALWFTVLRQRFAIRRHRRSARQARAAASDATPN